MAEVININPFNGGGSAQGAVRYDEQQTLTDTEKQQARSNIAAASITIIEEATEGQSSYIIAPNKVVKLGTLASTVAITLGSGTQGQAAVYDFIFSTGAIAPTITWPTGISWMGGSAPTINASKKYEVSISEGLAVCVEF